MVAKSSLSWDDGIIAWYNGPEWDEVTEQEFEKAATQLESEMRANAKWEDRTGDARANLSAEVFATDGQVGILLSHGVDYGYWLEVIQNGRFAIIGPTLEQHGRRITYNAIRRIRTARKGRA